MKLLIAAHSNAVKVGAWRKVERDSFFVTLRKANAQQAVEPEELMMMLPIVAHCMQEGYDHGEADPAVARTCSLALLNLLPLVIRCAASEPNPKPYSNPK